VRIGDAEAWQVGSDDAVLVRKPIGEAPILMAGARKAMKKEYDRLILQSCTPRQSRKILSTPLSSPSFVLPAAGPSLLLKASPRKQFFFVPGDERRSCRTQELENGVPLGVMSLRRSSWSHP